MVCSQATLLPAHPAQLIRVAAQHARQLPDSCAYQQMCARVLNVNAQLMLADAREGHPWHVFGQVEALAQHSHLRRERLRRERLRRERLGGGWRGHLKCCAAFCVGGFRSSGFNLAYEYLYTQHALISDITSWGDHLGTFTLAHDGALVVMPPKRARQSGQALPDYTPKLIELIRAHEQLEAASARAMLRGMRNQAALRNIKGKRAPQERARLQQEAKSISQERKAIASKMAAVQAEAGQVSFWRKVVGFIQSEVAEGAEGRAQYVADFCALMQYRALPEGPVRKHIDMAAHKMKACVQCHAQGSALKLCQRCKAVAYCSKECQKLHWSMHKKLCSPKDSSFKFERGRVVCLQDMPIGSVVITPVITINDVDLAVFLGTLKKLESPVGNDSLNIIWPMVLKLAASPPEWLQWVEREQDISSVTKDTAMYTWAFQFHGRELVDDCIAAALNKTWKIGTLHTFVPKVGSIARHSRDDFNAIVCAVFKPGTTHPEGFFTRTIKALKAYDELIVRSPC